MLAGFSPPTVRGGALSRRLKSVRERSSLSSSSRPGYATPISSIAFATFTDEGTRCRCGDNSSTSARAPSSTSPLLLINSRLGRVMVAAMVAATAYASCASGPMSSVCLGPLIERLRGSSTSHRPWGGRQRPGNEFDLPRRRFTFESSCQKLTPNLAIALLADELSRPASAETSLASMASQPISVIALGTGTDFPVGGRCVEAASRKCGAAASEQTTRNDTLAI
mmetsp:Transcript_25077/g.57363  ORF Transcript_25077/g.57363 Transcript_25077/m.57363 type:complete len:224 (-) Transcript_25077:79-750(-)